MGKIAKAIHKLGKIKEEIAEAQIEVKAEEEAKKEILEEKEEALKEEKKKEVRDEEESTNTITSTEESGRSKTDQSSSKRKTPWSPFSGSRVEIKGRRVGEKAPSELIEKGAKTVEDQITDLKEKLKEMGHEEHS